jgi:GT2 family glycosyltransferase
MEMGGFDELLNPAYFEDNDCRYRLLMAGNPVIKTQLKGWSHDNSSTLSGSDDSYKRMHWCLFHRNQKYYHLKWGGLPGMEKFRTPFGCSFD